MTITTGKNLFSNITTPAIDIELGEEGTDADTTTKPTGSVNAGATLFSTLHPRSGDAA